METLYRPSVRFERVPAPQQKTIRPGSLTTLKVPGVLPKSLPPVVEIEGIPAWVTSVAKDSVTFWMPADFWDRPAPEKASIRVRRGELTTEALLTFALGQVE